MKDISDYKTYWPEYRTGDVCRVIHKNGFGYLVTPDGKLLPKQISCKVVSRVNQRPYAVVKLFVDLDETIEPNTDNNGNEQRRTN